MARAFTPVLAATGGGTLLNILSSAAWINVPTGYAASKAALWSATNALRVELRTQVEVLADDATRYLKSRLNTPAQELYPWLDEQLASFVP